MNELSVSEKLAKVCPSGPPGIRQLQGAAVEGERAGGGGEAVGAVERQGAAAADHGLADIGAHARKGVALPLWSSTLLKLDRDPE